MPGMGFQWCRTVQIEMNNMIENHPIVSIIIATHNAASMLPKTLASLRSIAAFPFELLIADAGSTDETLSIIEQNKDMIAWFKSEPDQGVYDAWNKALKQVTSPWIAFLGAGDTYMPEGLPKYAAAAKLNPEADYIAADQWQVLPDGQQLRRKGAPWGWSAFKNRMTITHVGNWHAKKAFEQYGDFDTSYKIAGDYEWLLRAKDKLKVVYIPIPLVNMVVGGISDRNWSVVDETMRAQLHTAQLSKVLVCKNWIIAAMRKQISRWVYQR
jgi:glycosyltransferase involved in cell wall biosynthesis